VLAASQFKSVGWGSNGNAIIRWGDPMRSPGRVVSLFALVISLSPLPSAAQDLCNEQFLVSEVGIPAKTRLSPSEQAAIKAQLIGRCFDNRQLNQLPGEFKIRFKAGDTSAPRSWTVVPGGQWAAIRFPACSPD
jgi:hypothetical protein